MSERGDLRERLLKVDPDGPGERTRWYRNPDGPDAVAEIDRLRNLWIKAEAQIPPEGSYDELVELDRLRARCAELEKALEPFAKSGQKIGDGWGDDRPVQTLPFQLVGPTVGDFRRARAALQGQDNG